MKDEDRELIKQFVMGNDRYSFVINGHYIVPSNIKSHNGNLINIRSAIGNSKLNGNSKYVKSFKKDFAEFKVSIGKQRDICYEYIQEFPVPIEDLNLWNNLLLREGLSPINNSEFFNRRFFILDFLFFHSGVVVEIDSDFHDKPGRRNYDRARDKYLEKKYKLKILRIEKYGNLPETDKDSINQINNLIIQETNKYERNGSNHFLDFSNTIVNNFISDYEGILRFIDKIRNYLGDLFEYYNKIILTKLDLKIIDTYNFTTGLRGDQEKLYLDTTSMILQKVYSKELYIQQTEEYSLYDVLRVVGLVKSGSFTWSDFEGLEIRSWLINLVGYPPSEYTNISTPKSLRINIISGGNTTDGGIKTFISTLIKAGIISPFLKPGNSY